MLNLCSEASSIMSYTYLLFLVMRQFWISTKKTVLMSNPFRVSEQIDRTVRIVLCFCCPIGLHNAHHVSLVRKRFVFRSCQRPVALWRKQMFTKSYRTTYKPVVKPIIAKLSQSSSWSYDSWLKEVGMKMKSSSALLPLMDSDWY